MPSGTVNDTFSNRALHGEDARHLPCASIAGPETLV